MFRAFLISICDVFIKLCYLSKDSKNASSELDLRDFIDKDFPIPGFCYSLSSYLDMKFSFCNSLSFSAFVNVVNFYEEK